MVGCREDSFYFTENIIQIINWILLARKDAMSVTVCPYCNRQHITRLTADGKDEPGSHRKLHRYFLL